MKPEPLKDKRKQVPMKFIEEPKGKDWDDYPFIFEEDDIKLAVEWLIDIMESEAEPSNIVGSTRKNIDLEIAITNVKKAFKDVTKR